MTPDLHLWFRAAATKYDTAIQSIKPSQVNTFVIFPDPTTWNRIVTYINCLPTLLLLLQLRGGETMQLLTLHLNRLPKERKKKSDKIGRHSQGWPVLSILLDHSQAGYDDAVLLGIQ